MLPHHVSLNHLAYRWPSQSDDVFSDLNVCFSKGWTGLVGRNGCGKSTLLSLIEGTLAPSEGTVTGPESRLLCSQRTDEVPGGFEEFLYLTDGRAGRLYSRLGIGAEWPWRWDTLSHGERKKSQIATALWRDPIVLMVDEPTNHLDEGTRRLLGDALEEFPGIGLIVSHDRELLDRLCSQILFLDQVPAILRPGGISHAMEEREKEILAARRERDKARKEWKRVEAESKRRQTEASRADALRSKRDLSRKDSDGRSKIDLARITGKDGQAGRLKRQFDERLERARGRMDATYVRDEIIGGITFTGKRHGGDAIARSNGGTMELGDGRLLHWGNFSIETDSRIALTGPNGIGKSRFLSVLISTKTITGKKLLHVPQEISIAEGRDLMCRIEALNKTERGSVFSAVDRLGSDPVALMESRSPSPGETRKLLLALGLAREPAWIVMDEPTNHMDLASTERLEQALSAFPGALFLISHDRRFLERLCSREWRIDASEKDSRSGDSFLMMDS